ncbi:MAG: dTMP kinase [Burkholderiales bacterium]
MTRGRFVTLEGMDGAGKSTHLAWIAERLRAPGRNLLVTREPGGTPLAERLRELVLSEPMDPIAETMLLFAARADHVRREIEPALASGGWVLCDRFTDATFAYQGGGKGVPAGLIAHLAQVSHDGLLPDLTLVFDCPYDVSRERLAKSDRVPDRFERESRDFFERVRQAYLGLARADPVRIRVIDASGTAEQVKKLVEEEIRTI